MDAEKPAYEALNEFLRGLTEGKNRLGEEKILLVMQRQAKVEELEEALLTGDGAEVNEAINAIDNEIANLEQRITIINATLDGKRRSPALTALVEATIKESREGIGDLQPQWNNVVGELASLDAKRLELVGQLGEIDRAAQRLSNQGSQAADFLPPPKPGTPSLSTGIIIRHNQKSGVIFQDFGAIEKAFKEGVKE